MFNEKYSHEKKFTFDSKANEFISLKEFAEKNGTKPFPVRGMFTYEGQRGKRGAVVTDGFNVNVPEHLIKDIESIMSNQEEIDAINAGKCAFRISTYEDKKFGNGICYSGSFIDA